MRARAAVSALAVACAVGVGLTAAPSASASGSSFLGWINGARASNGLKGYCWAGDLAGVAQGWAQHMASTGVLQHNPGLTSQVSGWAYVGENVGYGPAEINIHNAFMNSAPHRANILDHDFTQVGVGVATSGGTFWVAEVFRRPSGGPGCGGSPAAAPAPQPRSATPSRPAAARPTGPAGSAAASAAPPAGPAAAPPPPPPAPTAEELLAQRAHAAAAGPGASAAADPVAQILRFAEVMQVTGG